MRPGFGWSRRATLAGLGLAGLTGLGLAGCGSSARSGREVPLWFTYGGRNREVLEALVSRFNQEPARVPVRPIYQGDYFEGLAKLRIALAARAAPALSHVVGEVVPYLAEAGVLEALDGYAPRDDFDLVPALGQSGTWIGGGERELVTLPFNRSTPIAYLNAELFERAGLGAPRTWEELRAVASALTLRRGRRVERYGFGCPVDWWFWVALVGQAGGDVVERDGRVSLGGEAGVRALELWQTLVRRDRSMKPPPGRDYNAWEQTNQDFLAGRAAMIWTSTAFLKYLEDNANFRVLAAPLPSGVRSAVPTGGTHWVILKSAEASQKRAAFRFLEFMQLERQAIEWATRTGYIPVTKGALRSLERRGHYDAHPNERVAIDQLRAARPWPWSPRLFRVQREIVQPRLERAVLADGSAREMIREGVELSRRI
jgi:sn-glycerol 3-phosphate transport system substrate-binding protein